MATTIEDEAARDPNIGILWGSIRTSADILAMLQQNRIRIGEFDNALLVEIQRDDGGIGVYKLPHTEALSKFP